LVVHAFRVAICLLLATFAVAPAISADTKPVEYAPGQIWSFRPDAREPHATLTTLRVESLPKIGQVVHISVSAVRVPTGVTSIGHLPMSRAAMDRGAAAARDPSKKP
jgi:hypothetical protein